MCVGTAAATEPAAVPEAETAGTVDLTELLISVACFALGLLTTILTGVIQKRLNKGKLTEQYNETWKLIEEKLNQAGLSVDRAAIEAALKQMSAAALKELAKAFNNDEQAE